jgi:parvulin-like peptidyl-prolyl isomerase
MISPFWRRRVLAATGALVGLVLVAFAAVRPNLANNAVAQVGTRSIRQIDYDRALQGVAADRRSVDAKLAEHVLDRLIDEELLVQHGMALGLATEDPRLRAELVRATLEAVLAERRGEPPASDDQLREHYQRRADLFRLGGRVAVDVLYFSSVASAERARKLLEDGTKLDKIGALPAPFPAPVDPLSKPRLRDLHGPRVADAAWELPIGHPSAPIAVAHGAVLVWVRSRTDAELPPFESVREQVREDLDRARDEQALQRWLSEARRRVRVMVRGK